ncbi:SRPBCC family protein [Inquilinus sp. OTU3971]|uniref:SRPBCC family protein n=1 Tax=Inquilinus sp. OTU3971 TaxID=3043855 RepID=UPI00313BD4D8
MTVDARGEKLVTVKQGWESDAPLEAVFDLVKDSLTWESWTIADRVEMECYGQEDRHGPGAIRVVTASFIGQSDKRVLREKILEVIPYKRIRYCVLDGLPFIDYNAQVDFMRRPGGGVRLEWQASFYPEFEGEGPMLRRLVEMVFRVIMRQACVAVRYPAVRRAPRLNAAA